MKTVVSTRLCFSQIIDVPITLTSSEAQIFRFIKDASEDIGAITGQNPTVRAVGGWVRDKLLNKQSKDLDLTVDTMGGDQFSEWLYKIAVQRFGEKQTVVTEAKTTEERPEQIKNLSVAFLRIFNQDVEILPLRGNEVYDKGSRNPISTQKSGPEGDAFRRDLTINSLFYNINSGQIEDFTGEGYEDLMSMTLRTPTRKGHDRVAEATRIMSEDPLRLLRIVRFYSRYPKSKIAPEVLEAMKNPDIQHQISRRLHGDISGGIVQERIADELRKIMKSDQPDKAISVMYQIGLLQNLLLLPPEYHPLNMDQKNKHHALNVIEHTLQVIKNINSLAKEYNLDDEQRMMMNFSGLFHDLGKLDPRSHKSKNDGSRGYSGDPSNPSAVTHQQASFDVWNNFAKAMKLSDLESSTIGDLVINHMNPHGHIENVEGVSEKSLRRYLRTNPSWVFQYIHAMADAMSKSTEPNPSVADPYRNNLERLRLLNPNADQFGATPPANDLLRGQDIISLVGLNPRPPKNVTIGYIEVIKEIIREQQDENPNFSQQDAINLINQLVISGKNKIGPLAVYFTV